MLLLVVMKRSCNLLLLSCLFLSTHRYITAYKILIFSPRIGYSHVNYFGRIADILVQAGYEVIVYLVNLDPEVKGNGTKLAHVIDDPQSPESLRTDDLTKRTWLNNGNDPIEVYKMFRSMKNAQIECCLSVLKNKEMLDHLRKQKFDLGITEIISFCGYRIFEEIGLKTYISASTVNFIEIISDSLGGSSNPSYVPASMSENSDVMTYCERTNNFLSYLLLYSLLRFVLIPEMHNRFHHFDIEAAVERSSFFFVNSDEFLEFPRLLSQKVVYVGGVAVETPKPLNEEYKNLMEGAKNGVVLVSFGSVAKSVLMTVQQKKAFHDAFAAFPEIRFIWKYEINDMIAANLSNVYKRNWVPQTDLLGHPNLRAFISHCGQNSLTESVYAGVPLICIPLFGDQIRNAKIAEKRYVSITVHKNDISAEGLIKALNEIIYKAEYHEKAQILKRMIREKPISPKERLLRYIQFTLKHGPIENFDIASNRLTVIQYYLLDIVVPVVLALCLIIYSILRIIHAICCASLLQVKLKTK